MIPEKSVSDESIRDWIDRAQAEEQERRALPPAAALRRAGIVPVLSLVDGGLP